MSIVGRFLLTPLRLFGLHGITNYILLPIVVHFVDFAAYNLVDSYEKGTFLTAPMIILISVAILFIFNIIWHFFCYYGLAEWVWRMFSYFTPLDLRRQSN